MKTLKRWFTSHTTSVWVTTQNVRGVLFIFDHEHRDTVLAKGAHEVRVQKRVSLRGGRLLYATDMSTLADFPKEAKYMFDALFVEAEHQASLRTGRTPGHTRKDYRSAWSASITRATEVLVAIDQIVTAQQTLSALRAKELPDLNPLYLAIHYGLWTSRPVTSK